MLEILTNLATSPALPYDIIFNFNGAEETLLQGAHLFITQHPWAKEYNQQLIKQKILLRQSIALA